MIDEKKLIIEMLHSFQCKREGNTVKFIKAEFSERLKKRKTK